MYIPAYFAADAAEIAAFVDLVGSADLVTFDGTKPIATLLPVIWERPEPSARKEGQGGQEGRERRGGPGGRERRGGPGGRERQGGPEGQGGQGGPEGQEGQPGGYGRLIGHIALQNPQWKTAAPGAKALAIVDGPQAYVSPSWYQSTKEHGRTVPTWNYTSVHFTGEVTFHQDSDWLREVVTRLTERYEEGRPDRWWVTDAPEKFISGQLRAIVGVELAIEQLEAKAKLSQNRDDTDRANVIAALSSAPDPQAREIADLMTQRAARADR